MPNVGISKFKPSLSDNATTPSLKLTSLKAGTYMTSAGYSFGGAGYPLGILLAITTHQRTTVPPTTETLTSDYKPVISIKNT